MTAIISVCVAIVALVVGAAAGYALGRRSRFAPAPDNAVAEVAASTPDVARQVVQSLAEGVVVVDRGDVVLLANSAAHTMGAMVGDRLATDSLRQLAHLVIDLGVIQESVTELSHGYLGREQVFVAVTAVPIGHDELGRVSAVALLLTDTTEARRLEDVRRDFVANVSHELKTPVGALTLLAEAVAEAADDPESVQRFANRMQHEGQRLGRLVGELIALSRVQGVDALPERTPVPVDRLFAEAIDRTRLAAERVGIQLAARVPAGLAVLGDESQLVTAVANLADNAVSYSPNGTRVVLSARALDAGGDAERSDSAGPGGPAARLGPALAELAVTDQGIGISQGEQDRIFERFYRVDPARSRATGGTGLGLAIVKNIVTNHGGSVHVWSAEGAGSTFSLRLPRAVGDTGSTVGAATISTKGNR